MNPENSRSKVGLRVDHARAYYSSNSTNCAREAEREKERDGASSEINLKWIPLYLSLSLFSSLLLRFERTGSRPSDCFSEREKRVSLLVGSRGPMLILFVYDYVCL